MGDSGGALTNGCTAWPDNWFGVNIRPCCDEHDLSDLTVADDVQLGICVARIGIESGHPLGLFAVGVVMSVGTMLFAKLARKIGEWKRR